MASNVRKAQPQHLAPPIPPAPPLPPVPDDVALPGDKLCPVCASLELTPRRFIVWPDEPQYGQPGEYLDEAGFVPLALVTNMKKNIHCPLCRLLLATVMGNRAVPDVDGQGRPLYIGIRWGTDGRESDPDDFSNNLSDIRVIFVGLVLESGRDTNLGYLFASISLLVNDAPPNTPCSALRFLPRPVRGDVIDFDLVRWWVAVCEARHTPCDPSQIMHEMGWDPPQTVVPAFRCIDLERDCLTLLRNVPVPANFRYAALSYVWGRAGSEDAFFKTLQANVAEREVPGFFAREENQRRLPATIRDAMTVARRIGIRYLWVDSLCIVQDGTGAEWLEAIRKMDIVYGAAYIVICASGTFSAFDGIDGLSPSRPRAKPRAVEQIAEGFRLACRDSLAGVADDIPGPYPYGFRGWT
ncbi:hypothetical protein MMYC01_210335 [Madurella mycetomatis]|uniref:Heterokaryon incompatibility domain-containing protein n=1 Tax=Madurella mycetomatis TaxID=100816 RepID=A0A175VQE0_9PEZI|nr:hypothetical protein MMYC01_210335 [Madurella mycetomatis]